VNTLNLLRYAGTRIYSAELTAAAWLEQRRIARRIMLGWYHHITTTKVVVVLATFNTIVAVWYPAGFVVVPLILVGLTYARVADKSHDVINEGGEPCPLCPAREDEDGHGGLWLDWNDDQPPAAPPPMGDYDDEQYHAWADDMVERLDAFLEEVSS
jgi:hypothetical protein